MIQPDSSKMEYRFLGSSGLKVSVMSFGTFVGNEDSKLIEDCVKVSLENGVNFFDTAEIYGLGKAETALGNALKKFQVPREKIVISTKIYKIGNDPNDSFLSRKHIIEGIKNSLKRLQLEYVDVVFCHRYDMNTPLEETCRSMNLAINLGLAFYWGTSEWSACQIMEAYKICEKHNLIPPIVEQVRYNMIWREKVDSQYRDLFKKYKMGTTIWGALHAGVLTGKYINEVPKDSRLVTHSFEANYDYPIYAAKKEEYDAKLLKLKDIAENKLGMTLTQLALCWIIANPDVSTCMVGASKPSQLEETLKCSQLYKKLDKDILLEIEKILDNAPQGEPDFRNGDFLPIRRNIHFGIDYKKSSFNY